MSFAQRLWIMVDIETSGPVIGRHDMTELGAAVGSRERGVLGRFSALIRPASAEAITSKGSHQRALREGVAPAEAMRLFCDWARPHLQARAQFIARPAAFDWPWVVYYAWTHLGENPLGFKAICASSWLEARGKRFDVRLPHVAVDDAEIQLRYFMAEG